MSRLEEVPAHDWARHSLRILDIIDNQVRRLRKRQLIEAYLRGDHTGCYWGIRTNYSDYRLIDDPLKCTTRDPPIGEDSDTPASHGRLRSSLHRLLVEVEE